MLGMKNQMTNRLSAAVPMAAGILWSFAAPVLAGPEPLGAVEIGNELVKARFIPDGEGIRQEYLARSGGGWVMLARGFRPGGDEPGTALYQTSADPRHRLLAPPALNEIGPVEKKDGASMVVLRGKAGGAAIEQLVEVRPGQPLVHIEVKAVIGGDVPRLEYLLVPFAATVGGKPDVTHAPGFKPTDDSVIGDRTFFSPANYVQKGGHFVALIPALDIINQHAVYAADVRQHPDANFSPVHIDPTSLTMPTALDLVLPPAGVKRPVLSYGMMDWVARQHVWFQHKGDPGAMVRTLAEREVRIGMDLLLSADAPVRRGYRMVSRYLWQRYGHEYFNRPRPQAMPYSAYADVCYPAHFAYQGYNVTGDQVAHVTGQPDKAAWQQWENEGKTIGGLRLHAPQWSHLIANLAWWNSACDAAGLYDWGMRLDPGHPLAAGLKDKARAMVRLSLSAPQDQGLFPAMYDLNGRRWIRSLWNPPAEGYNPATPSAYWDWNSGGAYQTASASVTAGYLLHYRRHCEEDGSILPYVRAYGDFLLAKMDGNGCVPGWFGADLKPLPSLKWNADGGAHTWVLAELYLATRDPKYLDGAKKAARFLMDEVMPRQHWADFEAFYSCAIKPETFFDVRTGQWPCNLMSVLWAMQGFVALHEATGDMRYLDAAEAVADFAALFQAVWAPRHVITAYPFGGMSSQLGDAEWLDQRAHRFAEPFVRIGLLAGRQDLLERGIAAARSSLTLTNHPRHQANQIYTHANFPVGIGPENIDHEGYPQRPLASGPSWNSVGGLAGVSHVLARIGGAYVDVGKNLAVGVDGVLVRNVRHENRVIRMALINQLAALPVPYEEPFAVELRVVGLPDDGSYSLIINDGTPAKLTAAKLASLQIEVHGDKVGIGGGVK